MNLRVYFISLFLIIAFCQSAFANNADSKKPLYWIDPMEPTIHYDKPGKSRMGMAVVPIYADENQNNQGGTVIKIAPEVVNNLSMRTAVVNKGTMAQRIETVGYVNPDETAIGHIHTYAEGWVRKLMVKTVGERVTKGQLLLQLFSPILINAEEEFLIALTSGSGELASAAHKKLLTLGVSEKQIQRVRSNKKSDQLIDVYAQQNGFITELNIREGMRVTPETTIMSLTDLADVWLMAEIYENQASLIAVSEDVEARLASMPNTILKGHIDYVYPQVDQTTRTLKIRMRFDNPNNLVKPGMYANVSILAKPLQNVIAIPQEALIRTGQGDRVIVALGGGRFEPRIVTVASESGDQVIIASGLKPGEQIVTSAQFLIDSEANLKGALDRLTLPKTSANHNEVSKDQTAAASIIATGVIKAINLSAHNLKIAHNPIKELNWPAMTMDFAVATNVDLAHLKIGDTVEFTLSSKNDDYVITAIK